MRLTWWTESSENGQQIWKYQSYDDAGEPNPTDKLFFWGSQIGFLGVWCLFFFVNFITLSIYWVILRSHTRRSLGPIIPGLVLLLIPADSPI